jgi:hypothetical protein
MLAYGGRLYPASGILTQPFWYRREARKWKLRTARVPPADENHYGALALRLLYGFLPRPLFGFHWQPCAGST